MICERARPVGAASGSDHDGQKKRIELAHVRGFDGYDLVHDVRPRLEMSSCASCGLLRFANNAIEVRDFHRERVLHRRLTRHSFAWYRHNNPLGRESRARVWDAVPPR